MQDVCLLAWQRNDGFAWFVRRKGDLRALQAPSAPMAVSRTSRLAPLQAAIQGFHKGCLKEQKAVLA